MCLTRLQKEKLINNFKITAKDTGSSVVQIALLTENIKYLANHLKIHKNDYHSKKGLIQQINKRKCLLLYLKKTNINSYTSLLQRLELRK